MAANAASAVRPRIVPDDHAHDDEPKPLALFSARNDHEAVKRAPRSPVSSGAGRPTAGGETHPSGFGRRGLAINCESRGGCAIENSLAILRTCLGADPEMRLLRSSTGVRRPAPMLVSAFGMQLHAAVAVDGRDRKRLERVCHHLLRPPFAHAPVERTADGQGEGALQSAEQVRCHLGPRSELVGHLAPHCTTMAALLGRLGDAHADQRVVVITLGCPRESFTPEHRDIGAGTCPCRTPRAFSRVSPVLHPTRTVSHARPSPS
jgi:hypothetical protein